MQLPSNPILAERWQLVDFLGAGAMGEVWRGRHLVLGHDVAIKLMKADAAKDRELVARFVREARIAARLRHRNIARVEDFGTDADGRPFLVMEYLRGCSLGAEVERRAGAFDRATVALIAQHVGAACDVAHGAGIVHRDLKPENCFVVSDDDGSPLVKVLDFGVAKVTDNLFVTSAGLVTASHALIGTPVYMSPEQARGQSDIDGRSDLWSLGIMVYELLTGRLPYDAPTLAQLLFAVLSGNIPPPSSLDPSLGWSIDAWAARALARDRNERFQSGRELVGALVQALGLTPAGASVAPPAPGRSAPSAPAAQVRPASVPPAAWSDPHSNPYAPASGPVYPAPPVVLPESHRVGRPTPPTLALPVQYAHPVPLPADPPSPYVVPSYASATFGSQATHAVGAQSLAGVVVPHAASVPAPPRRSSIGLALVVSGALFGVAVTTGATIAHRNRRIRAHTTITQPAPAPVPVVVHGSLPPATRALAPTSAAPARAPVPAALATTAAPTAVAPAVVAPAAVAPAPATAATRTARAAPDARPSPPVPTRSRPAVIQRGPAGYPPPDHGLPTTM